MSDVRTGTGTWKWALIAVAAVLTPMVVITSGVVALWLYLAVSLMPRPSLSPSTPLPPLHAAIAGADVARAKELLDSGARIDEQANGNDRYADGTTALHIATREGDRDMVLLLLSHGASLRRTTRGGDRPIHLAHESVIADLVDAGADIEALTDFEQTPLMRQAILHRDGVDIATVRFLLATGANPLARDMYGRTAADLIEGFPDGDRELIRLLREAERTGRE